MSDRNRIRVGRKVIWSGNNALVIEHATDQGGCLKCKIRLENGKIQTVMESECKTLLLEG
ncbi:hypothetical protein DRO66_02540 [Candidatus Bathyarchaeota archaeon]|nr:MAG: hypothetical protein DRO66_02540 [Candidatus Bathyarchaeota archaeon]